jgi:hypothetical protein
VLRAAQHALKGGVVGHRGDPHRQRDRLAPGPAGQALAVPALDQVREQALHGRWQAEPVGQHLGDLAEGGHVAPELPGRPRHAPRHLQGPHRRRAARVGQRPQDPGRHLGPRPEPGGQGVPGQGVVVAEGAGGHLRVGGAADVEQQAGVVGLRRRVLVDAQPLAEPHRQQRAVQAVLGRHPDPEVRRQ